jgi:2-(1,2-epoxy-1,2-dihydrophenyl)acetyl-CoA isomerase
VACIPEWQCAPGHVDLMTAEPAPANLAEQQPPPPTLYRDGDVLVCTFSRPASLNAVDADLLGSWLSMLQEAADDDSVRAVVTYGAGEAWCVGADVDVVERHLSATEPSRMRGLAAELLGRDGPGRPPADGLISDDVFENYGLNALAYAMHHFDKPLVAALNGMAVGGGMAWALLHDVRIASTTSRFNTTFASLGLVSELGMTKLLAANIGLGATLDLSLSSRVIDAEEAYRLGLVQYLVPPSDVLREAVEYAQRVADMPRSAVRSIRRLARDASSLSFEDYLRHEWAAQSEAFDSSAATQRFQALIERLKA